MRRPGRIAIRGLDSNPVARVIDDHRTGARKVRPLEDYQAQPLNFLVDVLKIPRHTLVWSEAPEYATHGWDGTPDPLVHACRVLAGLVPGKRHVAIEAATGTQKTYTAAGLVLWFLGCFEDSLVITTAPKEKQLKEGLWKEIGVHLPNFRREFPKVQAIDLKLRMRQIDDLVGVDSTLRQEKWAAIGWCAGVDAGAESAVRSQGFHAQHMMIVVEEMPGMDPANVTALKNTCTAPHNIMLGLGNPDNQLDPLHVFSELPGVEAIQISAYDHPNVVCDNPDIVPGATSRQFINDKLIEYGEDGPLFLSRVRGQSPKEAHNALIKHTWLEEAARKWNDANVRAEMEDGPLALGVDPAQTENGDRCALARWRGAVLQSVDHVRSRDALVFGKEVYRVMQDEHVDPNHVGVDTVGIGSNVVNYMRSVLPPGKAVRAIEGGAEDAVAGALKSEVTTPVVGGREYQPDANQYANMRAQVYWQLGQDLAHGLVALPKHEGLWRELMVITYETEGGVVRIVKKKVIKQKLGRSPDFADAVAYGNWVRPRSERKPRQWDRDIKQAGRSMPLRKGKNGLLHVPIGQDPETFTELQTMFERASGSSARRVPSFQQRIPRGRFER